MFFDSAGVTWDYECQGFDLGTLGPYLPDFEVRLPSAPIFVEVKPAKASGLEVAKVRRMAMQSSPSLLLEGPVDSAKATVFYNSDEWAMRWADTLSPIDGLPFVSLHPADSHAGRLWESVCDRWRGFPIYDLGTAAQQRAITNHLEAAVSARFEHRRGRRAS